LSRFVYVSDAFVLTLAQPRLDGTASVTNPPSAQSNELGASAVAAMAEERGFGNAKPSSDLAFGEDFGLVDSNHRGAPGVSLPRSGSHNTADDKYCF
jgi:hypothetical protein